MIAEEHHFTIRVEADLLRQDHFRWVLCESGQVRERSDGSDSTKGEAYADAANVLREYLANWHPAKWQVS